MAAQSHMKCPSGWHTMMDFLKRHADNVLLVLLIVFMCFGILIGLLLRGLEEPLNAQEIMFLGFPGDLLMRMLKMMILPLIISSLISGLANLDVGSSGRMGGRAVLYYLCTTFLAVVLGIILVSAIQPGNKASKGSLEQTTGGPSLVITSDKILDLVRSIFPDNLVTATFTQVETVYDIKNCSEIACNGSRSIVHLVRDEEDIFYTFSVTSKDGLNILGLLVFSIAFGITLGNMGEQGKPLKDFFNCLSEASMRIVQLIIWYSPIGVCFLIAAKLVDIEDLGGVLSSLGFYMLSVLVGLAIHGLIVIPLIYLIFVRKNPFKFIYGIIQAIVTAFATASSSATMPVTMRCLEENNHLDKRVVSFVIPVGATINMDGTALYEAVAALFIAQLNDRPMSVGDIIVTSVTATIASIGAAGVPSAGLITMIIVLNAVGLPDNDVAYILAIDWFLDRFRTAINVLGDSIGAGIVNHYSKNELEPELESVESTESANEAPTKTALNGQALEHSTKTEDSRL
ncbi:excitatory amino acid transporter 3-like isoform X2 [Watersipora subatra]